MDVGINLKELSKSFGSFIAVNKINLQVSKGEVLGFLGPNGAGKSTTMRMVAGFLTPTSGSVEVCGLDVESEPVAVKKIIGYMAEGSPSYDDMTVRSFLEFIAAVRGLRGTESIDRIAFVVDKVDLGSVIDKPIEILSKGFKRRVGLAQAILHDPPVLILDEPTDGLDPNQKHQVRALIKEMASNKAIVISTHVLEEVEAVCSRAVIIGNGRLLADGTSDELMKRLPENLAVNIVINSEDRLGTIKYLAEQSIIHKVIDTEIENNMTQLHCVPNLNEEIIAPVSLLLRQRDIQYSQLYQVKGDLDAVFRSITIEGNSNG
jgi:ABC-2 type transport system ATP-binding protein